MIRGASSTIHSARRRLDVFAIPLVDPSSSRHHTTAARARRNRPSSTPEDSTSRSRAPANRTRSPSRSTRSTGQNDVTTGRSSSNSPKIAGRQARGLNGPPLLHPHVLSQRLKKLCEDGKVDEAVGMLKSSPLDAQNPPVWNTLVWECMKAQRYTLAYRLFTDMKRRGFSPTTRTYQTMLSGLSRIEHWPSYPRQLNHAHALYEYVVSHLEEVKEHDPTSKDLTVQPIASYIKILGDAGLYQRVFDVFYAMDQDGPLSPDQFIFTSMLRALGRAATPLTKNGESLSDDSVYQKNASDAKLLWRQMLKASQRSPGFTVDSYLVTAAIKAMSRGRRPDQDFALEIAGTYLGLIRPGQQQSPNAKTIPLTAPAFEAVLELCNHMDAPELCIHFTQQVIDRPGGSDLIDRIHMEQTLKAHVALAARATEGHSYQALQALQWMLREEILGKNGPRLRPAASTFKLVLRACWHNCDWQSASKTFELMTGFRARDFKDADAPGRKEYKMEKRSKGRNLVPDADAMSCIVRTAWVSGSRPIMRQALRMFDLWGFEHYFPPHAKAAAAGKETDGAPDQGRKADKNDAFYRMKLASALVDTVGKVDARARGGDEETQWVTIRRKADALVRAASTRRTEAKVVTERPKAGIEEEPEPLERESRSADVVRAARTSRLAKYTHRL
ncbi:hypothetical protein PLICRDRAFT_149719 [Plicaturopsis crispa FD-325 SS-3]|nr:hypothetical protein PLICRDRAFT_149719 [Plicaturopsis crispa FD-325 SS-3]